MAGNTARKTRRIEAQRAREAQNRLRRNDSELTPWQQAKIARAERREGLKPQERTQLGNILVMGPDGIKRVKPGSKREIEMALHLRQEEAKREAAERKQTKKVKKAS